MSTKSQTHVYLHDNKKTWFDAYRLLMFFCLNLIASPPHADMDPFAERSLRIGVFMESFPYISQTESEVGLKYWAEKIGKIKNIPVNLDFYPDSKSLSQDFNLGKVNLIVASPLVIIKDFNRTDLAEGFRAIHAGNSSDNMIVVTRNDTGIKQFKDLKDKKIGMMANDAIGEMILDILTLNNFGNTFKKLFPKPLVAQKRSQLVMQLFFKQVDAVLIYERSFEVAVELNPQIKENTQIIEKFDKVHWGIGLFHPSVPKEFRELVISTATQLGDAPSDQQMLRIFEADRFERSSVNDLQLVDKLISQHKKLLNKFNIKDVH